MALLYDSNILQEQAERLYSKAGAIIAGTALKYLGIGGLISMIGVAVYENSLSPNMRGLSSQGELVFIGVIGVIAFLAGIAAGREKAFQLKLQAQQILCQREIEVNTRPTITEK